MHSASSGTTELTVNGPGVRCIFKKLLVTAGSFSISLKCLPHAITKCKGVLSVIAFGKKHKPVQCARGPFSIHAPHTKIIKASLGRRCATLLRAAQRHRLRAILRIKFRSGQRRLKAPVTLAL